MSKFIDAIRKQGKEDSRPRQSHSYGTVVGVDRGRFRVSVGGQTHLAESATNLALKTGDRVLVALGRGTARILGLLGRDEDAQ